MPGTPAASAYGLMSRHTTFSNSTSPFTRSALVHRSEHTPVSQAMQVHASIASFTQFGIGAVRTRPCMPTRSTMHQRPSRCWIWAKFNAAASDRRSPQLRRTAMIARSRSPSVVVVSGALSKAWACRSDSQFPVADALRFRALHPSDAGGQFGRQQAIVCGFGGKLANGRHADDYRRGSELAVL